MEDLQVGETEGEEKPQMKLNALMLEPVLEVLFDHLPMPDLNNCVSVCKLWSREAIRANKKRRTVELYSQDALLEIVNKLETNPRLNLINKLDTENLDMEDHHFERLLMMIKPTLSILVLNSGYVTLPTLHKYIRLLPNLARLEIGAVKNLNGKLSLYHQLFPVYDERNPRREVIFDKLKSLEFLSLNDPDPITPLSAALKTFPNLKDLTVSNFSVERLSNFKGIEMVNLEELTVMNLPGYEIDNQHFEMLLQIKFPALRMLTLLNIKKTIDTSLFKRFVESHREKLSSLDLRYLRNINDNPMSTNLFPLDLPNLKTLHVSKPYVVNISRIFGSLPKLNDLCFNFEPKSNWMAVLPKKMQDQPQIKNVTISWIEAKPLEILAQAFSAVQFLKIQNCDDNILRTIFLHMSQIKYLMCYGSKDKNRPITTEGLTAIPSKVFEEKRPNPLDYRTDNPYIANLKNLNFLHITFSNKTKPCARSIFEYGLIEILTLRGVTTHSLKFDAHALEFLQGDCGYPVCRSTKKNCESYIVYFGEMTEVSNYLDSYPMSE